MNRFRSSDLLNIGLVLAVFVVLNKLMSNLTGFLGSETSEAEQNIQQGNEQTTQSELDESKLTYPKSEYYDLADTIYTALQASYFTDEDAIYQTFRKLKNNSDYLQLKTAYGLRPHGFYGTRVNKNMVQSLRSDLDAEEIDHVNRILSDTQYRKIKYRI